MLGISTDLKKRNGNFPSLTHSSQALASSYSSRQAALCCSLICLLHLSPFFSFFPLFSILAILIFPKAGSFQKWISQIRGMRMFKKLQLGKTDPVFKGIFSHTWQHFTYNLNLKCPLLSVTACAVLSFFVLEDIWKCDNILAGKESW